MEGTLDQVVVMLMGFRVDLLVQVIWKIIRFSYKLDLDTKQISFCMKTIILLFLCSVYFQLDIESHLMYVLSSIDVLYSM